MFSKYWKNIILSKAKIVEKKLYLLSKKDIKIKGKSKKK